MSEEGAIRLEGTRWRIGRGLGRREVEARLRAALRRLEREEAVELKRGRRKRLFSLALRRTGPPDHLLKRNRYPVLRSLARPLGRSKSRRELEIASALVARGVPAIVPLAAGERRCAGRLLECSLLIPLVDGATDLRRCAADPKLPPAERRELARAAGALARRAHDAGLAQDDFAPNNVLVRRARPPELWLIDFERAALRGSVGRESRGWMLAKLHRAMPGVGATQRMRFLRAYTGGDRAEARRWWRELARLAPRLALRDHVRMRRASTSSGRRFRRVAGDDWWGFSRRETPLETLAAAARAGSRSGSEGCRIEAADGTWRVHYAGARSVRRARELWARANTLFARGLAPRPLGLLLLRTGCLLVAERAEGERTLRGGPDPVRHLERAPVGRFLERLMSVGELSESLRPEMIALAAPGAGPARATLIAPHAFRFSRRSAGAASREVASRLLRELEIAP